MKVIGNATSWQYRAAVVWVYLTGNHLGKDGEVLGHSSPGRKETSSGRRTGLCRGASRQVVAVSGKWALFGMKRVRFKESSL